MIYKILGEFTLENFEKIINNLNQDFKFVYLNGILYISLIDINKKEECQNIIKKIFKPSKNFIIKEINEKNIMNQDDFIINWCKDQFVEFQRKEYERDQKEKIRKTLIALDKLDDILSQEIKKGKEESNVRIKKKRQTQEKS